MEEISQKLSSLRVPIHIIYGEKDFMIASEMRRLKQELPAARHTVIPNCGHFLQEDQPKRLSELLVYECDSPPFFRAYLNGLPQAEGKGVFIFCTKGAFAGNASRRNLKRLIVNGYIPLGYSCVGMPGTEY